MKIRLNYTQRLTKALGSNWFMWLIIGLLVVQAAWIALSGLYPMAFDEDFHLGVIKLYAAHATPFWSSHPAGGDAFGALARDPSYLYHYLMSFPYRFIGLFTDNQTTQVIILRFINIGLSAAALPLYRRLLLKTGASRTLVQGSLLILVLVPITPLLAAQINYDNVIMPLTAIFLLLTLKLDRSFKPKSLDTKTLLAFLGIGVLTTLVKYAFLPIFVAAFGYLLVRAWQKYKRLPQFAAALASGWRVMTRWSKVGLIIVLLLSAGLFAERYGVNLAKYHTPVPDCAQVLDYNHCKSYGPWIRDYNFELNKGDASRSPISFTQHWFYGMWFRSFFAVDGPATDFQTRGPLVLPSVAAIIFVVAGGLALLVAANRLWRRYSAPVMWLFVSVTGVYIVVLWLTEYQLFLQTGRAVAINGRYLLPVLPFLVLLASMSINQLLEARRGLKALLATVAIVCFAWGGGAFTYILRSNDSWYWPNSTVRTVNYNVRNTIGPIVPGYRDPTKFLH
ncbi:MAG TPA: hypothetical protein VK534_01410 [Methylomirabilota bacterium]|nr:hypothetical protein [Methylomirabilota bacterium]